jgi:hypothetical protein
MIGAWIRARSNERSTWRGLALVCAGAAAVVWPEKAAVVAPAVLAVVGAFDIIRKE